MSGVELRDLDRPLGDLASEALADHEDDVMCAARSIAESLQAETELLDRLRASSGPVVLHLADGRDLSARVAEALKDAVLLTGMRSGGTEMVPLQQIAGLSGLPPRWKRHEGRVPPRSMGSVLRQWSGDQIRVRVAWAQRVSAGTILRVGADHLDLVATGVPDGGAERAELAISLASIERIQADDCPRVALF